MLVVLCDTPVLVAATLEGHPHHVPSLRFLERVQKKEIKGFLCVHSLVEFYATLTPLPLEEVVTPRQVEEIIDEKILHVFQIIELELKDYRDAIRLVAESNLKTGIIFDALIVQAALKRQISRVITWNRRHFERLAGERLQILTPDEV